MVSPTPCCIAFEGPCCAGKTTLSNGLQSSITAIVGHVRDYSDWVGGGRFLPSPQPVSADEEEAALKEFIKIEDDRTKHLRTSQYDLILIDRSVHTLIAHCHGLKRMSGADFSSVAVAVLRSSEVPVWPQVIFYLDIPTNVALRRNTGKFRIDSIYMNREFNSGIRQYFLQLSRGEGAKVIWLDASIGVRELRDIATRHVQEILSVDQV